MLNGTQTHDKLAHITFREKNEYLESIFKTLYAARMKAGHTKTNMSGILDVDPKEISRVEIKPDDKIRPTRRSTLLYDIACLAYCYQLDLNDLIYGAIVKDYDPNWIIK